jgi:hypothetical protein
LTAGSHAFKLEFFERGGWHGIEVKYSGADTGNRQRRVPASAFQFDGKIPTTTTTTPVPPPANLAPGLQEDIYYNWHGLRRLPDTSSKKPSLIRGVREPYYRNTGHNWPNFEHRNNYVVQWSGWLKIRSAGRYGFWTYSDDGSRLSVNNQRVVDNDGLHGWRGRSGYTNLPSATVSFKLEFFERGGWHGMEAKYSGPDTRNRHSRIPATALFHDPSGVPTTTTTTPVPPPANLGAGINEKI